MVAGNLWASLLDRVASPAEDDAPNRELRLTGDRQRLDQIVTVRPHTVVVIFEAGAPPRLAHPGDYLLPRLRRRARPTEVLVVNTATVELDVTVDRLRSFDRLEVGEVTLRLTVQLTGIEDESLLAAAATQGADLESHLLAEVTGGRRRRHPRGGVGLPGGQPAGSRLRVPTGQPVAAAQPGRGHPVLE